MKSHVQRLIEANLRLDGRKNNEYREIKVEYGVAELAEGSSRVTIGKTIVMCGVKMSVTKPYPDQPDKGTIMVGAEELPLSNPDFESGPPNENAIEWARVTDRAIRESGSLDFNKMCITAGDQVWVAAIDIYPINDDGNLFDAGALAAIAAIQDTRMPEVKDGVVDYQCRTDETLPFTGAPLSCTVWRLGNAYVVDPIKAEEKHMDARLTVATRSDGKVCALQKGGVGPLSATDVKAMVALAVEKTAMLRKTLR